METERGPSPALAKALDADRASLERRSGDPKYGRYERAAAPVTDFPYHARALIRLGRFDEAAALLARTPSDCYDCVIARGTLAEAQGKPAMAQRFYAEAARQGPRLAPAFVEWGRLLVRTRRYDSALTKLEQAARIAPNWADPLKYKGDALAAQGKREDARAAYDAALERAPRWQTLRDARARLN